VAFNRELFWEVVALVVLIIAMGPITLPYMNDLLFPKKPNEIVIHLYTYEAGGFQSTAFVKDNRTTPGTLATLVLKKGQPVRLILIAMDAVHSFTLARLLGGIKSGPISPGTTKVIEFTPDKVGTYVFYCGIYCSPGHPKLRYTLIVEEDHG